jgi:GNAT superfamily N-acetyltransferase
MSGALLIRLATVHDTQSVLSLVRQSLGEGTIPRSVEYWEWKHVVNPFGQSPCLLAVVDGEIVGLRAFMRWRWQSGRHAVPTVRAVDTATHKDWRGKGIFRDLTLALVERMTAEGVGFVFNTPNSQSRPGYLKMGWTNLGRVHLRIRPSRPGRIIRALARRNERADVEDPQDRDDSGFAGVASLVAEPGVDALLGAPVGDDSRLVTRLTREYLAWRYAAVPGFRYYAAWVLERDAAAAVIFRLKSNGTLRELRVCDLAIGAARRSVAAAADLLGSIVRQAGADYGALMSASGTAEQAAALRAGFLPAPGVGPVFTVRPLASGVSPVDATQLRNWRPSIGALELF